MEEWKLPNVTLGHPMQTSRTVQDVHQVLRLEDESGLDGGQGTNIIIDNQQ